MLQFQYSDGALKLINNHKTVFQFEPRQQLIGVGKGKNEYRMERGSFRITEEAGGIKDLPVISISGDENAALLRLSEGSITLTLENANRLRVDFELPQRYNRLYLTIPALLNEHVYGCGENFSEFDLRGKLVNVWVAEHINAMQIGKKLVKQIVGIKNTQKKQDFSNYETYYAQPTFLSSRKYYFHSAATARSEFDFTQPDRFEIKTDEIASCYFGFGNTYEEVLRDLSDLLGRQPELPDWVYDGEILGIQGGTAVMMDKVNKALSYHMDVAGVWIQDWEGRRVTAAGKQLYWNWEWDKTLYPGLDSAIKELNSQGIKVLGYCNPFLAVEKPLYKEASALGYCVKNREGADYYVTITTFPAAMVDLTNPDAWEWLKGKIRSNMIGFGLSGWMADFGEYLPTDAVLYSGEDAELVHNTWPARWAKLNREVLEETGNIGKIMFFTRAGYSETPKYSTMMWNGDNHVDYSIDFGLPSVIPAMLSLTVCGFGLSHSDIGGYTSFLNLKRSEELYMRWCEMNAFTPVLRGHEGLNPDLNAQLDASDTVLRHGAAMSRLHKALKPYLKAAVKKNHEEGFGVVRPLFFHYDEPRAYTESYEFLLGRDLLVAPVLRPGTDLREVYLPEDTWIHLPSGREYRGGVHPVYAPVGSPPVFARKDGDAGLLALVDHPDFHVLRDI